MKYATRMRIEREQQEARQKAENEKFTANAKAFRLELQALCVKYGVTLEPYANPSNNIHCDPTIEIMRLAPGTVPELVDRFFDDPKPVEEVEAEDSEDDDD